MAEAMQRFVQLERQSYLGGMLFTELPCATRKELIMLLNIPNGIGADWRELAEKLGFETGKIKYIDTLTDHKGCSCSNLFDYIDKERSSLRMDKFYQILVEIERADATAILNKFVDTRMHQEQFENMAPTPYHQQHAEALLAQDDVIAPADECVVNWVVNPDIRRAPDMNYAFGYTGNGPKPTATCPISTVCQLEDGNTRVKQTVRSTHNASAAAPRAPAIPSLQQQALTVRNRSPPGYDSVQPGSGPTSGSLSGGLITNSMASTSGSNELSLNLTVTGDRYSNERNEDSTEFEQSSLANSSVRNIDIISSGNLSDDLLNIGRGRRRVDNNVANQPSNTEGNRVVAAAEPNPDRGQVDSTLPFRGPVFLTCDLGDDGSGKEWLSNIKRLLNCNRFLVEFDDYRSRELLTLKQVHEQSRAHFLEAKYVIIIVTPSYKAAVTNGHPGSYVRDGDVHTTIVDKLYQMARKELQTESRILDKILEIFRLRKAVEKPKERPFIVVLANNANESHIPKPLKLLKRFKYPEERFKMVEMLKRAELESSTPAPQVAPASARSLPTYINVAGYDRSTTYSA